jgi:hypothetical protein
MRTDVAALEGIVFLKHFKDLYHRALIRTHGLKPAPGGSRKRFPAAVP